MEVRPLTPEDWPAFAEWWNSGETTATTRWCWCAYFRVRGVDFSSGSDARHRAALEAAVVDDAADGRAPGLVAYHGGEAVGWVSVGPRSSYERLTYSKVLAPLDDTPVWSIVCFVVGRRSRGKGVAKALLGAAVDYARAHGATCLEAYPVEVPDGGRVPSANAYQGTLTMFERAGFTVVERRRWNASSPIRPIVRLPL